MVEESGTPTVRIARSSYENVYVQCPWCGQEIVFNRATDLRDLRPIGFRTVSCLNQQCGKPFSINGDLVNSAQEMLVFDSCELLQAKHYMSCILTLTQAYEVLFNLFLRVELLYKPFAADPDKDRDLLNSLAELLEKEVKDHAFGPMRALFLHQLVSCRSPRTLVEAKAAIEALADFHPEPPSDTELGSLGDKDLVALLKRLRDTDINGLRNSVVHKQAYRPTRTEAETALEKTRAIIFPLTQRLDLHDDPNWYMSQGPGLLLPHSGSASYLRLDAS